MNIRTILLLAALLGLASCEGGLFAPDDGDPPIRTSADEYVLETTSIGLQTEISIAYANRSDGPYYLVNCGGSYGFWLEKWVEDRWVFAWAPTLPLCLSPVIRIDSRATFPDTLGIIAGFPGTNFGPQFQMALIPREQRVSNEFRLATADQPTD